VKSRRITLVAVALLGACGASGSPPASDTGVAGATGDAGALRDAATTDAAAGHDGAAAADTAKADTAADAKPMDAWASDAAAPSDAAGLAGFGGIAGLEDLSTVKPSAGCGKDPGQPLGSWQTPPAGANKYMFGFAINTPATPKGSFTRRYFVMLPKTYDRDKPYRVVFEAPKCGGVGYEVPAFDIVATATDDPQHGAGVIQVGLSPDPTVWMAGCFDQQAGDETIEKAFIEALWPAIASSYCIDEHRVFMAGYDSGAWLTNQLGHVYGSRLFRAISPSGGALASGAALQSCLATGLPGSQTQVGGCLPTPGIWWHDAADAVDAYAGSKLAIEAALAANHCTNATFAAGPKAPFATLPHATCVSYSTCPAAFPVVLCTATQQDHKNLHDDPTNLAATWAFFRGF
jgi:hypothetical protein